MALTAQGLPYDGPEAGNPRVPDLVYFAAERNLPDESYPDEAPDLAVAVRSPGQGVRFLQNQLAFLRQQRTPCTLLIDRVVPASASVRLNPTSSATDSLAAK